MAHIAPGGTVPDFQLLFSLLFKVHIPQQKDIKFPMRLRKEYLPIRASLMN